MKIGVCRGLDDFDAMKAAVVAGVDYWETGFGCLANFTDEEIKEAKAMLDSLSLKCIASNGFIPGDMPLIGDSIDYVAISDYLDRGFERAEVFGVKKIVLGSGKARSFPEGYSKEKAIEQLVYFLDEYAAPRAIKIGGFIVVEPLRFNESSMIHMVRDSVEIGRMCKHNNVFGLADLYHVYGNNDDLSGIDEFKGELLHAHIAEPVNRLYPSTKDEDYIKEIYKSFFDYLKKTGCDTCSIEARTDNFAEDIKEAVAVIKNIIC